MMQAALAVILLLGWLVPAGADTLKPTILIVDSSGSMAAALDNRTRLDAARHVLADLLGKWPADAPLGLIAYGHRRTGDCNDIEVLAPVGPADPVRIKAGLAALKARGKTPLAASLERAAALLKETSGTIILVTDGLETCHPDPCAVAAALKAVDAKLIVHVVGFAVGAKEEKQLSCIAEAAGGDYRTAADSGELLTSLEEAADEAIEDTATEPEPVAPVKPEPAATVLVSFAAVIEKEGPLVGLPVAWRVLGKTDTAPVYEGGGRAVAIELPAGSYRVEARASNAVGTAAFEAAGTNMRVEVPLAAGRLGAHVVPYKGGKPLEGSDGPVWLLEPLDGQPPVIVPALARPALLIASGRYRLAVDQAGRHAETEVVVTPGQPLDIELSFRLGELELSAAVADTAEPLRDWRNLAWRALTADGSKAAMAMNEAAPVFKLPQGTYQVELDIAGTTLARRLDVVEGKRRTERFIVPTGRRTFAVALGPNADPLTDWRDTAWTVRAVEAIGMAPGTALLDSQLVANPSLSLLPGRWTVKVTSGLVTADREIMVAPESDEAVRLDLDAARLTIVAQAQPDQPAAVNVVFEVAPLAGNGETGKTTRLGGDRKMMSSIVPSGGWRVTATDEVGRGATQDVMLAVGEERQLVLGLE